MKTTGHAAQAAGAGSSPFSFERRAPSTEDVAMEIILSCDICHTEPASQYPQERRWNLPMFNQLTKRLDSKWRMQTLTAGTARCSRDPLQMMIGQPSSLLKSF